MYSRKKPVENVIEEDTVVWTCETDGCNGWMRDNFAFDTVPNCYECNTPMVKGTKLLPALVNTNKDIKSLKSGISIK